MAIPSIIQPGVEVQSLYSEILKQDLLLFVKLPWRYGEQDRAYPVLYSLDANRSFPLLSTMSLVLETPGMPLEIPGQEAVEILIVGIGYQVDSNRIRALVEWSAWRTRDLTPIRRPVTENFWVDLLAGILGDQSPQVATGGAATFLQAVREEVIPFIEANYRADPRDRGLAGYSYGGLFTLYALFNQPGLFSRFFAGSPSMWEVLFEQEGYYASRHDDLPARLLMTAGSLETDQIGPMNRFLEQLRSRDYPHLELITQVFEGETHASCYAAAASRALRVLYSSS